MGYPKAVLQLIARGLKDEDCSGKVLTFGRNGVDAGYQDLLEIFRLENKKHVLLPPEERIVDPLTQFGASIHQDVFFKMMGYSEVHAVDYYPNEKPTFILDLNKKIPPELEGQYDLVSDSGTMEHCFDVKEVLFNTVRLVKTGGYVCIHTPMSGFVNHGFYSFSPTLFFDFYGENGFEKMQLSILRDCGGGSKIKMKRYDYDPATAEVMGDLFPKSLVFFLAKKKSSQEIRVPIQGYYRAEFGGENVEKKKEAWKEAVKKILGTRLAYFLYRMSLKVRRFVILNFKFERMK